jgi:branched-chain amino acid transport system substrate-binding protein
MSWKAWLSRVVTLTVAAIALGAPVQAADPPYEIHAILSQTGNNAFVGGGITQALQILEKSINAHGGIAGRPVRFVLSDDATSPETAVQLMNAALTSKPSVVVDGGPTSTCRATAALAVAGPLLYCLSPGINPAAGSFVFSTFYSVEDILKVSIRYLRDRGIRKLGIINATDASGQIADAGIATLMSDSDNVKAGMRVVAYEHYNLTDLSVTAQISRIKAAGAEALIVYTVGAALNTALHAIADVGLSVPVVASPGNMSYAQLESLKSVMPKDLLFAGPPIFVAEQLTDAGVRTSIRAMAEAYSAAPGAPRPDLFGGMAWDAMTLVTSALQRLGPNASPAQLRDALAKTRNYPGVLGRYDFRTFPQRGLGASAIIMERWSPDGARFVSVSAPGGSPLK